MEDSNEASSSSPPPLLPPPMLTLTVGNSANKTMSRTKNSPDHMLDDDDDPNDPNRFNAYLNRGSELWTHWSWLGGQGKMSLMRCNYCLVNKQLKNAPKCRRHLIKCPKTPDMVRKYFEKKEVEATRVSALMRELRSKEIKFPRNRDPHHNNGAQSDSKLPVPTANDLKHLHNKHHQASINNVIVKQNGNHSPGELPLNGSSKASSKSHHKRDLTNSQANNNKSAKNDSRHNAGGDNNHSLNELNYFYQQIMSIVPTASNESIDLTSGKSSQHSSKNGHVIRANNMTHNNQHHHSHHSNKLKRKFSPSHDGQMTNSNGSNGNGINGHHNTNKENKEHVSTMLSSGGGLSNNNNTVVINLDDVNSFEQSMLFNEFNGALLNGGIRKKKRDSVIVSADRSENGKSGRSGNSHDQGGGGGGGVGADQSMTIVRNTSAAIDFRDGIDFRDSTDFHDPPPSDHLDMLAHDDLNDLLASALISAGIDFDFIANPYFQKFITQLSGSPMHKHYRLPSVDKLSTINLCNLFHKFDYEAATAAAMAAAKVHNFTASHLRESKTSTRLIGHSNSNATTANAATTNTTNQLLHDKWTTRRRLQDKSSANV